MAEDRGPSRRKHKPGKHAERQDPLPKTAIVVDDASIWTDLFYDVLRERGYDVEVFDDGLAAAGRIRNAPPALLITDFFLANIDGGKLCQLAKAARKDPPVITIIVSGGLDRLSRRAPEAVDILIAKHQPAVVRDDLVGVLRLVEENWDDVLDARFVGLERVNPRRLVAKLRGLKRYMDAVHEGIGDAVISVDDSLRVFLLNSRAAQLLEVEERDAIALDVRTILGLSEEHALIETIRSALDPNGQPSRPMIASIRGYTLRITVSGLEGPDGRRTALLIARDLSDLKAAEEERLALNARLHQDEKMVALGKVTAGVAHEINNPLSALLPNLQVLAETIDTLMAPSEADAAQRTGQLSDDELEEARQILADCRYAGEQIRRVTASMLQLSRPKERRGESTRLEELLESALSLVMAQVRPRAKVIREYSETPPLVVNRGEISQAILNILLNALQAIDESPPARHWIQVGTACRDNGVTLTIANSGILIPETVQRRIFEPFFTTRDARCGTGLGLSITYDIVQRHGGYITVHGDTTTPTAFDIWMPLDTGLPDRPSSMASHALPQQMGRVLLVDDEPVVRQSFRRVLAGQHEVTLADSGDAALEILSRDRSYDCVLCDLIMPGMSGMQLYHEVQQRWPKLADRFVFLTGGTSDPEGREFLQAVPNRRAYKPLDPQELLELVASNLRGDTHSSEEV